MNISFSIEEITWCKICKEPSKPRITEQGTRNPTPPKNEKHKRLRHFTIKHMTDYLMKKCSMLVIWEMQNKTSVEY